MLGNVKQFFLSVSVSAFCFPTEKPTKAPESLLISPAKLSFLLHPRTSASNMVSGWISRLLRKTGLRNVYSTLIHFSSHSNIDFLLLAASILLPLLIIASIYIFIANPVLDQRSIPKA